MTFVKKSLLAVSLAGFCLLFAGCSAPQELFVFNASDYINAEVLEGFEKEFNAKIIYNTYESNEAAYDRLISHPGTYDVAILSDYMIARMIKENMLQPLDFAQIPNFTMVESAYKNLPYDANNRYSVPYLAGTLGLLYNADETTVDSWGSLWDSRYTNEILMLKSERDAVAAALKVSGLSMNSKDLFQIDTARVKLQQQMRFVKWYQTDEIKDNMAAGRAQLALTYSGEAYQAMQKAAKFGRNLKYVIPKDGSNKFVDSAVVLKDAKNATLAQKFINYLCQADVAAKNAAVTGYTPVVNGARAKLPVEMQSSEVVFPSAATLANSEYYDYDIQASQAYQKAWMRIRANL